MFTPETESHATGIGWSETPSYAKYALVARWAVGHTALDLGCGRGWYASALADRGFQVVGVDVVNRIGDPRVEFRLGEIKAPLPFPDAGFDTTLMFDILEHLEEEEAILTEVARVTRQRLLVTVPNADDAFLPRYGLTYLHRNDRTHRREYACSSLAGLLESHGFRTLALYLPGLPHTPLAFAEFVRGPRALKSAARHLIAALFKVGLLANPNVAGDIFWAGERLV